MIDNVTATDVANEISMMRTSFKGTFIVVEGITDSRLYGKFIEKDDVKIIIAHSKDNVRRSVNECRLNRSDLKTLGIVDSDLDRLRGWKVSSPMYMTDRRDMETMIICTRALDDVLAEYADQEELKRFESKHGSIRDVIARSAAPIGLLMFISQRDGLGLCFKDLNHRSFIDRRTLDIDFRRMIEEVYSLSRNPAMGKREVLQRLSEEMNELEDLWDAVRGHDAVDILTIGLTNSFGSYNARDLKEGQVGGSLRLAFSMDEFCETDLYKDTSSWSKRTENPLWISR